MSETSRTLGPDSSATYVSAINEAFWTMGADRYAAAISTWAAACRAVRKIKKDAGSQTVILGSEQLIGVVKGSMAETGTGLYIEDEEFTTTIADAVFMMTGLPDDPMSEVHRRFTGGAEAIQA